MAFRISALAVAPLLAIFALGVACEDQLVPFNDRDAGSPPSSNGGGIGQGGFTTSLTLVGGSTSISPTGGVAGGKSTSGFGGAGGGSACAAGSEAFTMEIDRFDGTKFGCAVDLMDRSGPAINGVVKGSDAVTLTVDECPPDQSCGSSQTTTVTAAAPGLQMPTIPLGNFVTIEFDITVTQGGCVQRLQITDLPVWDQIMSPSFDRDLWLAAADGSPDPFPDAPFGIQAYGIGDCGPEGIDAYALQFYLASDPTTMIEVFQSQTATWQVALPSSDTSWQVRNLRSYQTGNTTNTTNWAYWVTPIPVQPN